MMVKRVSLRSCGVFATATLLQCVPASSRAADAVQDAVAKARTVEIPLKSHDGHDMFGKLTLPTSPGLHPVVVYVQTAEGMTADMKRPNPRGGTFNYFDLYREKLPELNVGFFGYEGRGIRSGDAPPRYERIDWTCTTPARSTTRYATC